MSGECGSASQRLLGGGRAYFTIYKLVILFTKPKKRETIRLSLPNGWGVFEGYWGGHFVPKTGNQPSRFYLFVG